MDCTDIFIDCLDHEDENVQLWAAGFCLKICPKIAKKKLKKLSKSSHPFIWLCAKGTLNHYKNEEWDKIIV